MKSAPSEELVAAIRDVVKDDEIGSCCARARYAAALGEDG
jgi:hypothetical protein